MIFNTDFATTSFVLSSTVNQNAYNAFFSDIGTPWVMVLCATPGAVSGSGITINYTVLGLAKLNILSFHGSVISADRTIGDAVFQTGQKINGNLQNGQSAYELADLWTGVQALYNLTIPVNLADGDPYPYACTFLQALFNGYLQASTYQTLQISGLNGARSAYQEGGIYANGVPSRSIYSHDRWNSPKVEDWLAADSYLDWKLLRALLVTYYAGSLMNIDKRACSFDATTNKVYLEEIFANPFNSISSLPYVGINMNSQGAYTYVPVLPATSVNFPLLPPSVAPAKTTPPPTPAPVVPLVVPKAVVPVITIVTKLPPIIKPKVPVVQVKQAIITPVKTPPIIIKLKPKIK